MNQAALLLLSLCFFLSVTSAAPSPAPNNSSSTCPMDLNYVLRIPWNTSFCHQYETNKASCCQNLLSLFQISLAQHLKETSLFQLPDLPTSISCLQDFQSKLTALSFPSNLVSSCFNPLQFVLSRNICAQIESTQDWVVKLGSNTPLDSGCRSDLTLTSCDGCLSAVLQVFQELISIDGNSSKAADCFYFAVLYAAGIVNKLGPESDGVLSCIFALPLHSQVGSASENRSARFGSCFWVNSSWGCGFGHVLFVGILLLV